MQELCKAPLRANICYLIFGLMQTCCSGNSAGWATAQNITLQGISIEHHVPDYLEKTIMNHQHFFGTITNNHHTISTQKASVIPWNF